MTLEAFELLIGKVVQTDSSGTILEPLAPATAAAKLCFTGLLFFLFQGCGCVGRGGWAFACARILRPAPARSPRPPHSPRIAPRSLAPRRSLRSPASHRSTAVDKLSQTHYGAASRYGRDALHLPAINQTSSAL
ncbi:unnamed protein product [Diatraea saccharalis]|uniref:Uncharacterized protein n=1 Tax=Diatraea saccharalis TaxID=40085 RepID=A0A9N9QUH7_9NEOP|nr:unnamed protein product [Diatraea saccharalis]